MVALAGGITLLSVFSFCFFTKNLNCEVSPEMPQRGISDEIHNISF